MISGSPAAQTAFPWLISVTTATSASPDYRQRRLVFLLLCLSTIGALTAAMTGLMAANGWRGAEIVMLVAFIATLPWLAIGFWNAVIGFWLTSVTRDPVAVVAPMLAIDEAAPITGRTAITMTVRNENPQRALTRLRAVRDSLLATGAATRFDFHLLSDTSHPELAAQEQALFSQWQAEIAASASADIAPVFYRRRQNNAGFKAGNIMEFCQRCGDAYDFFLPLDADSLISGTAVLALVRRMQANPRLGILQGLVVGVPSASLFARLFQFGMRHGMCAYTMGSAWWQGDCGPFWGHNALIRTAAFRDHCQLPLLPGKPPLGGHILSHDQVEAVLMRRAGYEVRVWPIEDESFEENPPSLPDFIKRDLRWCQGNMQYGPLLLLPGLLPVSRIQLALAMLMYAGAPSWMLFILGTVWLAASDAGPLVEPVWLGLALFITIMTMALMPKLMGVASILCRADERRRYGGAGRILAATGLEIVLSALFAPVVAFADTLFMAGLPFGRQIRWEAQQRDSHRVSWHTAWRGYWPQTLFGLTVTTVLALTSPQVLPWAAPTLLGFMLVMPLAVLTAWPALGRACRRIGLFDIPEDRAPAAILDALAAPAAGAPGQPIELQPVEVPATPPRRPAAGARRRRAA